MTFHAALPPFITTDTNEEAESRQQDYSHCTELVNVSGRGRGPVKRATVSLWATYLNTVIEG